MGAGAGPSSSESPTVAVGGVGGREMAGDSGLFFFFLSFLEDLLIAPYRKKKRRDSVEARSGSR